MSHPAIAVATSMSSLIDAQSFADVAAVSVTRNPSSSIEDLTGVRIELVPGDLQRTRVTRATTEESVSVDIHIESVVDLSAIDSEIDTLLDLSYSVFMFVMSNAPAGWHISPDDTQEPLYSIDDIRQTGEFRSVIRATYERVVSA